MREQRLYAVLVSLLLGLGSMLLLALAVLAFGKAGQLDDAPPRERTITVSGMGKVRGTPDISVVNVGFTVGGNDVQAIQRDANRKMTALTDAIKAAGVAAEDIRTVEFSTYPQYAYEESKPPRITGYEVRQTVEVRIRDLEKVEDVLGAATRAGATNISNLQFTIDEPEQLRAEARGKAIAEARAKAQAIATQLGVALGRPIAFAENGGPVPPYPPMPFALEGRGGGGGDIPKVEQGSSEIFAEVTVTYELD